MSTARSYLGSQGQYSALDEIVRALQSRYESNTEDSSINVGNIKVDEFIVVI